MVLDHLVVGEFHSKEVFYALKMEILSKKMEIQSSRFLPLISGFKGRWKEADRGEERGISSR